MNFHSKTRRRIFVVESAIFILSSVFCCAYSLVCYECFDTSPTNANCTRATHNCTGNACILYESGDNRTSSAFCLLSTFSVNNVGEVNSDGALKNGCWLEADGRGKHCICTTDFCNRLRDRTQKTEYVPESPPLPELEFLKHSPFIDYEYIDDEQGIADNSSAKRTNSVKKLTVDKISELEEDSIDDESDLVPVDFDLYQDDLRQKEGRIVLDNNTKPSPSSNIRYEVNSTNRGGGELENSAFKVGLPTYSFGSIVFTTTFHIFVALLLV